MKNRGAKILKICSGAKRPVVSQVGERTFGHFRPFSNHGADDVAGRASAQVSINFAKSVYKYTHKNDKIQREILLAR
jgi:hypothetical protein